MEFAGERLGGLLWDPAALPGQNMMEEFIKLNGLTMSERMRELMRLRSDKAIAGGLTSRSLRTMMDGTKLMEEAQLQGLEWE